MQKVSTWTCCQKGKGLKRRGPRQIPMIKIRLENVALNMLCLIDPDAVSGLNDPKV